jgi:hypothetical protein
MTLFAEPLTGVPAGIVTPWVEPVIATGSDTVTVVPLSQMAALLVEVVVELARGTQPVV